MLLLAAGVLVCATASPASAATNTYWWDPSGSPANWDTTDTNWNSSAGSGGTSAAWSNNGTSGNYAVFSNTGFATAPFAVNLTSPIYAAGLDFSTGSGTLTASGGGSLTMTGPVLTGSAVTTAPVFDASLGTLQTNSETWSNYFGQPLVVNSALAPNTTASGTTTLLLNWVGPANSGFTFNGVLADNGGQALALTIEPNPGTTTLNAANTYSGETRMGGSDIGLIAIGNNSAFGKGVVALWEGKFEAAGSNPIALNNNFIVTAHPNTMVGSNNLTINGTITNEVTASHDTLDNNGTGLLTLAGQVYLSNVAATGGTLNTVVFGGTGNITVSGGIADCLVATTYPGSLTYAGSGTLSLTGTNTYSGPTTLTGAGILQTNNPQGFGAYSASTGSTPSLSLSAGTLGLLNDKSVTFGPIGGSGPANGYNFAVGGNVSIDVDNNTVSGGTGTGQTLTLGSGTIGNQTLTLLDGHGYSLSLGTLTATSGPTFANNMTNGTATLAALSYTATSAGTVSFNGSSATAATSVGPISQGSGALSLIQSGSGMLVLKGANTYSGGTTVSAGTLDLTGSIASTNTVTVNAGGMFTGNGSTAGSVNLGSSGTIAPVNGTLSMGGSLTLASTAAKLSFAPSSGSASSQISLAGALIASASTPIYVNPLPGFGGSSTYNLISYGSKAAGDSFVLASNTAGTSIVSGTLSSTGYYYYNYNLALNDTGSVLQLTASLVAPALQDQWSPATGGTWGTASNWTRTFVPGPGTTAIFGGNLASSDVIDFGGVNHTVAAVSFSNALASYSLGASGGTNTLIIDNTGGSGGTGSVAAAAGFHFINAPLQLNSNTDFSAAGSSALFVNGGISGSGSLSMSGSGSVSIVNAVAGGTISNAITVNPGGHRILGGAHNTGATIISGPIGLAGTNLTLTAASGGTVAVSGAVGQSAAGSLSTAGPGAVVLSGSNSYSGGTTVGQGILNAGAGNLGNGPLNLAGGTFQPSALLASGLTAQYTNALNVTQNSDIDLPTVFGDTYQFPSLSIGADTLTLTDGTTGAGVTISGPTTIGGATTFNVGGNAPLTLAGAVRGTSNVTKNGSGTLVLDGTGNGFTGIVMVNRGAIQLDNAAALVSSTVMLDYNNGLAFGSGVTTAAIGGLAGVSNELLQTSGGTLAAVALSVGGNGQSTTYSGALSGSGSLFKIGAGTLVLSGSDTYSGRTVVDGGTLVVATSAAVPGGSNLTVGAGGTFLFDPSAINGSSLAASPAAGIAPVPEPGTLALLAVAGLTAGFGLWRRKGVEVPASRRVVFEQLESRTLLSVGGGYTNAGILGEYYTSATALPGTPVSAPYGSPAFTRQDARIDFNWGTTAQPGGSSSPAFASVSRNNFSVLWTGEVIPKFSQNYAFTATTVGGDVLYIRPDGSSTWTTLINDWSIHAATADTASYTLIAGQTYDIEFEYRQPTAGVATECKLHWSSPSTPDEAIEPATALGVGFDGGDAAFANMVNAGSRAYWWVPGYADTSDYVATDSNCWPEADAEIYLGEGDPSMESGGTYLIQFSGTAQLVNWPQPVQFLVGSTNYGATLPAGAGYNSATNTTTATMVVSADQISDGGFWMTFTNTSRDGKVSSPEHNGITNLYVMQPTTEAGSIDPQPGTLFTQAGLDLAAQYTTLRLMDFLDTNGNLTSNWSDRTIPGDNIWNGWQFLGGSGVDTGNTATYQRAGVPWEVCVALGNETGKDLYINIPSNASIEYIDNLADLFAYGSDGVNPYTSPQANPVWAPLNSNLKVYIEFSNEVWNYAVGFGQNGTGASGWSNQLSQRAVYDYETNNQNDPLYPGGGANAYNDGAILAPQYITSGNKAAFLATLEATPNTSNASWSSPEYFSNAASLNGYAIYQGWVALRLEQISTAFKAVLGDTGVNANATASRVRPLLEWQYGGSWSGELSEMQAMFGSQHPVDYYLYGGGGGWYVDDNTATGFDDTEFANCDFTAPVVSGYQQAPAGASWTFNGTAGMAANGSSLGNPTAPTEGPPNAPNGSTQTAYLLPGASLSQSVDFSGGWADITLFASQTSSSYSYGLTISIDGGAALELSEGGAGYSGSTTSTSVWGWERTGAFNVTAGYHTVTFKNTSSSGGATVFLDDMGIQTVNGLFKDAAAQGVKNNTLDLMSDVALCQQWGLYDVGYEGGFDFNEDKGLDDSNGYDDLGEKGDSSAVPNVGAMANLDPRAEPLVITTLDQFYNAGGTLPMVFDSSSQINGWAVAAPTYYNYDTPKQQAAATLEASLPPTGVLPANWFSTFFGGTSLGAPPGNAAFDGTTWTLRGTGGQVDYTGNSALAALTNFSGDTTVIAKMVSTQVGGSGSSRAGIILADSDNGASTMPAVELGVYGYGSSSFNNGSGIIELTAQLSNGSQDNPLATANVATPYMVQSGNNGAPDEIYNSPVWLKLVETGSGGSTVFTGYYSMDGVTWTKVGATIAGQVSFSHSTNVAGLVSTSITRFTNVTASPLSFTTPPTASPSPVTGTTCALATQGQGVAGGIVYTWSASTVPPGAAQPTFSANNGTGTGQNTTAAFYAAGTYVFTATMTDSAGNVAAATVAVVVNQTPAKVVVTPSTAIVTVGMQQSFSATLDDQFGGVIAAGFTWAVTGGGSVDADGNYTAPGAAGTATLTATSSLGAIKGMAAINVVTALPAAPASLAATLISSSEIDLSWPAVSGATGYNVYRGAISGDESVVPLNSSPLTGTTYRDLSVSGQTTYFYVVQAVNAVGVGAASPEATATTPALPVTFTQNLDIGAPQQAGSLQYAAGSGVYTVAGGGGDIWGDSDSFHFDCLSLSGDGSILAQVTSVQYTSPAAKAGLMFRDSTNANAMMAMLAVTPGAGLMFETRTTTGGPVGAQLAPGFAAPIWLELSRTGNQFTAYYCTASIPSSTSWIAIGSTVTVPISNTALVGLAVTAHAVSALNTSTFSGVTVSSSVGSQAVPVLAPGALQFTGGNDSLRIVCDPGDASSVDVYVNSAGSPTSTIPLSQVTQWQIVGGAGNDQLTVDFSNGDPLPAGGLSFDGPATSRDDSLTISGTGPADSVTLSPTQLTFDGSAPIVYSNVQTVALDLSGADCTVAGSLAGGTSLLTSGSGCLTPATGFTQAGDLTVVSGTMVLNSATNLASGANLTVGPGGVLIFDPAVASASAAALTTESVAGWAAVPAAVSAAAWEPQTETPVSAVAAAHVTASADRSPADIHGAAIRAEVKAFDDNRQIDLTWLAATNDMSWSSFDKREATRDVALQALLETSTVQPT